MAYEVVKPRVGDLVKSFFSSKGAYGVLTFLLFAITLPTTFFLLRERQVTSPQAASEVAIPSLGPTLTPLETKNVIVVRSGNATNTSLEVIWSNTSPNVTSFSIAYTQNTKPAAWKILTNISPATVTYVLSNLQPGSEYLFAVQECTGSVCQEFTSPQKATTLP